MLCSTTAPCLRPIVSADTGLHLLSRSFESILKALDYHYNLSRMFARFERAKPFQCICCCTPFLPSGHFACLHSKEWSHLGRFTLTKSDFMGRKGIETSLACHDRVFPETTSREIWMCCWFQLPYVSNQHDTEWLSGQAWEFTTSTTTWATRVLRTERLGWSAGLPRVGFVQHSKHSTTKWWSCSLPQACKAAPATPAIFESLTKSLNQAAGYPIILIINYVNLSKLHPRRPQTVFPCPLQRLRACWWF